MLKKFSAILATALLFTTSISKAYSMENIRVVTYNIAMGLFYKKPIKKLVKHSFLRNNDLENASIINLQEICVNKIDQLELYEEIVKKQFGEVYSYSDYADPADPYDSNGCAGGQSIVSRYPIINSGTIILPKVGADHTVIWADLRVPSENGRFDFVRVYNGHFSNRQGKDYTPIEGRLEQAKVAINHYLEFRKDFPNVPVIFSGDFNSLGNLKQPWKKEPMIKEFYKYFEANINHFTMTNLIPYHLDWIFTNQLKKKKSKVVRVLYSDHFPVSADYTLD